MKEVKFCDLEVYIRQILQKLGLSHEDGEIVTDIYISMTKRDIGHHDIYNLPSRIEGLKSGKLNPVPCMKKTAAYSAMECWDGDNGLGELINHFAMQRAVELAQEYGIGMCTVRNSNHYLCSAPYVLQAAEQGCIGFIIAKGVPSMGVPGTQGKIVGQSPIGFAFPAGDGNPVLLDICLAYASGEQLKQRAADGVPVPLWWGVDKEGNATTSAEALLRGTKYPVGEHKGFGLAILCELLTGVLSGGLILDQDAEKEGIAARSTSHTAFAIKTDALLAEEDYGKRSAELVDRIRNRSENVHIPGDSLWKKKKILEDKGKIFLKKELIAKLNDYALEFGVNSL